MAKKDVVAVTYRLKPHINSEFENLYTELKEDGYIVNKNALANLVIKKGIEHKKELKISKV